MPSLLYISNLFYPISEVLILYYSAEFEGILHIMCFFVTCFFAIAAKVQKKGEKRKGEGITAHTEGTFDAKTSMIERRIGNFMLIYFASFACKVTLFSLNGKTKGKKSLAAKLIC